MIKVFAFKLYDNPKKKKALLQQILIAAEIYNHCIALHKKYYQLTGQYLSQAQLKKHITKLKRRPQYAHWKKLGSQAIQDIVERIDRAYKLFFKATKKKSKGLSRRVSPPNFKKSRKYKSFTLKQAGYELLGENKIRIGDKVYTYWNSREIQGKIKTVTVKRDALGDIHLYIACEVPETSQNRIMTGKSAGCDFGLKTFLTLSDGTTEQSPLFYNKGLKKLRTASKDLSSKAKGSNNRERARRDVARKHKKVVNQRKDYLFKTAQKLTKEYDNLFFEDLSLQGMQKLWGRKVSDLSQGEFLKTVQYYGKQNGSKVNLIDRFYPSSKTCHNCQYVKEGLALADRTWQCPDCKMVHDRDLNAAINIKNVGASTFGLGDVRPTQLAISA
jgi:putative transposase